VIGVVLVLGKLPIVPCLALSVAILTPVLWRFWSAIGYPFCSVAATVGRHAKGALPSTSGAF
jgi:hypothetical protein